MSDFKGTPGSWLYIDATKEPSMQYAPKCVIRAGNVQVASFSWGTDSKWWPSKEESQANARLIAAAPELLEALEQLVRPYGIADTGMFHAPGPLQMEFIASVRKAKDAIAKATGSQS